MSINQDLEAARQQISKDYGDIYIDYAHDLVQLRLLAQKGFSPRTIYDVGGSDGIWSSIARTVFPDTMYEIFEPLAEADPGYAGSIKNNSYSKELFASSQARMHAIALGDENGQGSMTIYPGAVGSTSIKLDHRPAGTASITVPKWRMDDYCDTMKLQPPDLIKLDTQGSELEILQGAIKQLSSVGAVLCECWLFKGYGSSTPLWLDIANYLAKYELSLFDMGWEYRNPADQRIATEDMLFLKHNLPFSPLKHYTLAEIQHEPAEACDEPRAKLKRWLEKLFRLS